MTSYLPVAVVVPIRNEKKNLAECLSRLGRFDEVIVVDSQSQDGSADIAQSFGATLLQFKWDGQFPKKRNWVLLNHKLTKPWVLFLDADELVDDAFCDEIAQKIEDGQHSGFWLSYTNYFLSKQLRYGVPQRKLALFQVGKGLYERIDEKRWSDLDMEVHEHPIIEGGVGQISTPIVHNDRSGLAVFIERHRSYAIWESRRLLRLEEGSLAGRDKLTIRQRIKYANLTRWWFPWSYFAYAYFVRLGFLDGRAGFFYAFYKLWYFETVRQLVAEGRRDQGAGG
ncbi:MAG: glycosyltransferase family 2 protein [Mesorhizobium sp.]|uniref:glycosyltransferase family 2 protein n=1 Tax=Mesorhizobium sp. TaxID=1871066 RepID=UPI000FE65F66|nr:glycosyltransferase family 2 protein [Mesorhizobium sp.]RWC35138.1 MAG: glycosyltransferase family 2 protein [Mesorhizobium sp.]